MNDFETEQGRETSNAQFSQTYRVESFDQHVVWSKCRMKMITKVLRHVITNAGGYSFQLLMN